MMERGSNRGNFQEDKKRSDGELTSDLEDGVDERRRDRKERQYRKERRRSSSSEGRHPRDSYRHRRRHHRRRDGFRSRSRSTSASRSSDRRRNDRRHRSRSRSLDSRGSCDSWNSCEYGGRFGDGRSEESYKSQVPNNTVMARGLGPEVTQHDIRQDLLKCGISIKDIRLIRHRESGASRGFAFVEFHTVADAIKWMEQKKGILVIPDLCEANLIYSVTKGFIDMSSRSIADWYCSRCRGYNFKRRETCYKCNEPRPPDQNPEIAGEISQHPTSTIMLYNLDILTTEESVLQAFQRQEPSASIPIRSVRISRESGTNLSRGVCYVETNNLADAILLYGIFTRDPFEVDQRKVQAAYHRPPNNAPKSNAAAAALAAAQWTNSSQFECNTTVDDIEQMAEYSANLYAKTKEEQVSYLEYYREYYRKEAQKSRDEKGSSSVAVEISSQSSDKKRVELAATGTKASLSGTDPMTPLALQGVPGANRYQYDENSGYYYDPVSGLYYDANTRYFYDSVKQQYMYWDPSTQKYSVVQGENLNSNKKQITDGNSAAPKPLKSDGGIKIRGAKSIAKNMEKWQKTLKHNKEKSVTVTSPEPNAGFGTWSKVDQDHVMPVSYVESLKEAIEPTRSDSPKNLKEISYSASMPIEVPSDIISADSRFLDLKKMACLLCKRMFSCEEILMKHVRLSDLHKQNLASAMGRSNTDSNTSAQGSSGSAYRDRAKERRLRFGSEQEVASNSLKVRDLYMKAKTDVVTSFVEEPTKEGIKHDNIGNRMLKKLGWQEGQGLGKDNKGIIDPITAERRVAKLGLGVAGAEVVDESDDRQTKARKLTWARYQNLEG